MPEQSHNAGEDIVRGLVTDEQRDGLPADEASIYMAAVEDGPEIDREKLKRKGLGLGAWLSIIWIALLIGTAILQPVLVSTGLVLDPEVVELPEISGTGGPLVVAQPPSLDHPFGLSTSGQDILALVLEGSRRSRRTSSPRPRPRASRPGGSCSATPSGHRASPCSRSPGSTSAR